MLQAFTAFSCAMNSPATDITAVLLAAGQARRFGSDKRRLPCPPHDSLMAAALAPLQAVFAHIVVVLRPGDAWGALLCRQLGLTVAWSFQHHTGQAASVAAALPYLRNSHSTTAPQAMLVALADMGQVQTQTLQHLVSTWRAHPNQLLLPSHQGRMGNPRIIPAAMWPLLKNATGDDGVRRALPWSQAQQLPVDDAGVLLDVDTPQDAQQLLQPSPRTPSAL